MSVAVSLMPLENRRETLLHLAVGADRRGYDGFFLPETWAHDTTVLLAEAAVRTERVGLGTGVLSIWSRSPGQIAMAAATLHDVSRGRFTLGLGASTKQLTEGLHDVPFTPPVRKMRSVVTQVKALLRGERVPLETAKDARPLRLNLPPAPEVPIYLAGLADATVRLAGEVADGWVPFLYPRSRLGDGAGAPEGGRGPRRARGPAADRAVGPDRRRPRRRRSAQGGRVISRLLPDLDGPLLSRDDRAARLREGGRRGPGREPDPGLGGGPAGGRGAASSCRRTSSPGSSTSPSTRSVSALEYPP